MRETVFNGSSFPMVNEIIIGYGTIDSWLLGEIRS
jgi:hypothetical protein